MKWNKRINISFFIILNPENLNIFIPTEYLIPCEVGGGEERTSESFENYDN